MDPDDVSNPTDNELAEILLGFNPIPVPVPVPDQPLAIPAAAANPLPNPHPVQLLGNGQIPSIYRSFQDYLSTCSHLGCRIQISDENSSYCCTEHLNLASNIAPGNSYALHYIGGFEDVQEMQRCCVIGIYNKLRNIGIGVPTLDTGEIFSTLPWEQHLVFNTTVVGNCAWLFFTQPPECYPLMGNQRMKWDLKNRKDVSIFANQNPVSMRPLNLRSYRASAEVMERSRGWNLYLFESGPEALYCLTFSNRQRRIRKSTPKLESSLIDANKESQPPATKKLKSGPKDVHGQELTVLNKGISNVGGGSSRNKLQRIMEFLHYCHSLTSESGQNCSLVVLNHEDIYSIMEISANGVIKAEPLASGLVNEVHGQVLPWNSYTTIASSRHKLQNFLLKIMEFLHYYHSLTSESGQNCLLVILNHEDIYLIMERPAFYRWYALQMDGVIKAEPLSLKFK